MSIVTRNQISQHLDLGFPFSKTVRNGFLWFKPHGLWYCVTAAWAKTGSFVCSFIYSTTVFLSGTLEIKFQPLSGLYAKEGQKNPTKIKAICSVKNGNCHGENKGNWEGQRSGKWVFHAVWSDKAPTETGSEPWILWRKRILSRGTSAKIWKLTSSGNSKEARWLELSQTRRAVKVLVGGRQVMHRAN